MAGFLSKIGLGPRQVKSPGRLRQRLSHAARTVDYKPQHVAVFKDTVQNLREHIRQADQRGFSAAKRAGLRIDLAVLLRKLAITKGTNDGEDKLAAAEECAREAIALAAEVTDVAAYVLALDALSEIFAARSNWTAVEKATEEAQRLSAMSLRPDPLQAAHRVHLLGTARHFNGRPEEAIDALDCALLMHEKTYGPEHLKTADVLLEIGKVFRSQGAHEAAQEYLHRAYRIRKRHLGETTPEVIEVVQHFAMSLHEAGDMEGAVEEFERFLVLKELQLGIENIDQLAEFQYSMAMYFTEWGVVARARELVTSAVGTFRSSGGIRLAVSQEALGQLEEIRGYYSRALEELEGAGKIWESFGPGRSRELIRNILYRADMLEEIGRGDEAEKLRKKAASVQQTKDEAPVALTTPTAAAHAAASSERTRRKLL